MQHSTAGIQIFRWQMLDGKVIAFHQSGVLNLSDNNRYSDSKHLTRWLGLGRCFAASALHSLEKLKRAPALLSHLGAAVSPLALPKTLTWQQLCYTGNTVAC